MEKGLIHIYTGNGKGKTTAATGLAFRCCQCGFKVLFTQFFKNYSSGECEKNLFFDVLKINPFEGFSWSVDEKLKSEMESAFENHLIEAFRKAYEENYDMLVLDEVLFAVSEGYVKKELLVKFLKEKPCGLEVVMTGRNCPKDLYDCADYVSEINKIKHPYSDGTEARKGIEF